MTLWLLVVAALLLSIERVVYVWAACAPESFRAWCTRFPLTSSVSPVRVLWKLFYAFKVVQFVVFIGWCVWHHQWAPSSLGAALVPLTIGGVLLVLGQVLNFGVFYRLGITGVFYGNRFGEQIPWCRQFPFSLCRHPQYLGTLCSIWGFFVAVRFPHEDWYVLPILETLYYAYGAYMET